MQLSGHVGAADAQIPEAPNMKDPVYKLIELTGTSTTSIEDAVDKALKRVRPGHKVGFAPKLQKNPDFFVAMYIRFNQTGSRRPCG